MTDVVIAPTVSASEPIDRRQLENPVFAACGLSWITALIHVQAAIGHLDEFVLYAIFFVLLAFAQGLWGVAVYRSRSRPLLIVGVGLSLATAALWAISRTSGLPIGPAPWSPEPVGLLDTIATANEVVLALVLYPCLGRRVGAGAHALQRVAMWAAVGLILLGSLALVGGHAH